MRVRYFGEVFMDLSRFVYCYIQNSEFRIPNSEFRIPNSEFRITINFYIPTHVIRPKTIVLVTNRVLVAPFGPKLSQNESYGLQEPFKTPPGPP